MATIVANTGVATGINEGDTTITAASAGVTASTNLNILGDHFLYVANRGDSGARSISQYSITDSTGQLLSLTPAVLSLPLSPQWFAISPSHKYLYVTNFYDSKLTILNIDTATGKLTTSSQGAISVNAPEDVAISPTGDFLYVANSQDNTIVTYKVDSTNGSLVPKSPISTGIYPYTISITNSGNYLYTANYNEDTISMYSINLTNTSNAGELLSLGKISTYGSKPTWTTISPSDKFLYVANNNNEQYGNISIYEIISTGLSYKFNVSVPSKGTRTIIIEPKGKYAYVSTSQGLIYTYSIDPTNGNLNLLNNGTVNPGGYLIAAFVSPSGKYIYFSTHTHGNTVLTYKIGSDGILTTIGSGSIISGNTTTGMAMW